MPHAMHDRVKETATTTGTGNFTLAGAVSQFVAFSTRYVIDEIIRYAIVGQTGTEWEVGRGHLSASSTLVRDVVEFSSNADTLVNFSAGTKDVFSTIPSTFIDDIFTKGQSTAQATGQALP